MPPQPNSRPDNLLRTDRQPRRATLGPKPTQGAGKRTTESLKQREEKWYVRRAKVPTHATPPESLHNVRLESSSKESSFNALCCKRKRERERERAREEGADPGKREGEKERGRSAHAMLLGENAEVRDSGDLSLFRRSPAQRGKPGPAPEEEEEEEEEEGGRRAEREGDSRNPSPPPKKTSADAVLTSECRHYTGKQLCHRKSEAGTIPKFAPENLARSSHPKIVAKHPG